MRQPSCLSYMSAAVSAVKGKNCLCSGGSYAQAYDYIGHRDYSALKDAWPNALDFGIARYARPSHDSAAIAEN